MSAVTYEDAAADVELHIIGLGGQTYGQKPTESTLMMGKIPHGDDAIVVILMRAGCGRVRVYGGWIGSAKSVETVVMVTDALDATGGLIEAMIEGEGQR